jgi:hypothetical protein
MAAVRGKRREKLEEVREHEQQLRRCRVGAGLGRSPRPAAAIPIDLASSCFSLPFRLAAGVWSTVDGAVRHMELEGCKPGLRPYFGYRPWFELSLEIALGHDEL